jgi:hypothetical protein
MVAGRAAVLLAGGVLLCGCGGTSKKPAVVIGGQSASGKHASATASADAGRYVDFTVAVTASPNQRVTGGWVVSCRVGTAGSRDAENFSGRTPLTVATRSLGTPQAGCEVTAVATLTKSGRVSVKLRGS